MKMLKAIATNGYMPIFPILIWNLIFTSKLPAAYDPKSFNSDIPLFLLILENIFRSIIFILPLFFKIDIFSKIGKKGFFLYLLGSLFYYLSWLMLMFNPENAWSKGIFGFTAPASTPIIWLIGISLMANSFYFKIKYSKLFYILPSILFSLFHIAHAILVFVRTS